MSVGGVATIRERLIAAAAQFTAEHGWTSLTMAKLANRVGVSRQTVYNELGGKDQLAEAMVMHELEAFLALVDAAFADHPERVVDAIRAAARGVLDLAQVNPLLHAVVSTSQGVASELLPLLTINAEGLLGASRDMIRAHVDGYDLGLPPERLDALIDMVIRLVLSHVMTPSGSPDEVADTIAWLAARALG